jgi:hypothetical protein
MAGEEIYQVNKALLSPLGTLMLLNNHGFAEMCKVLRTWLQDLKDAGVDLGEYGKREFALRLSYDLKIHCYGTQMGFTSYGPAVEDWVFYAQEPTDRFAGIFWKLVEKQTQFGVDSRAELDFSGTNNPDWSDESDDSDWSYTSYQSDASDTEPEPEPSEMNIPGSWATFDDENN